MFGYCYDFTPDVEQTSIDEGYFDLSGARKPAIEIARTIRKAIRAEAQDRGKARVSAATNL